MPKIAVVDDFTTINISLDTKPFLSKHANFKLNITFILVYPNTVFLINMRFSNHKVSQYWIIVESRHTVSLTLYQICCLRWLALIFCNEIAGGESSESVLERHSFYENINDPHCNIEVYSKIEEIAATLNLSLQHIIPLACFF